MTKLAIIADDLTGALDAAAPFASAGRRVRVATLPEALDAALRSGADVVAVSTRSREIPPDNACASVRSVMAALPDGWRLFKKVDSRLKGNIAAELDAIAPESLLVLPAIPEFGRRVEGGMLTGFGVAEPIPVAKMLGRHARRALIPNCKTAADMDRALADAPPDALLVGARGLATALAGRGQGAETPRVNTPMVVVVGSTDPITMAQVARLRAARPNLRYIAAPGGIAAGAAQSPAEMTLLQAVPGGGSLGGAEVAAALADSLADLRVSAKCLVLTGGATAEAALDRLGLFQLDVMGEVLPGLPLALAGDIQIVTKSGGFGDAETLLALALMAGAGGWETPQAAGRIS